ncbi:hypothetical protein BS17DRAFT_265146 [Gyrodon lividus]|nr:hypothetical protein BS17DRAFT_265146 [Gyrodon lividus]
MSSSRISVLLNWCADNGVQIDSRIQVIESSNANYHPGDGDIDIVSVKATDKSPGECGFGVYSCEESIGCGCTLVYIPKTVALSVKSCFLSQEISPVPHGHGAHLSLALALYGELLRGPNSRWFGYLQSLPRETVDIAMFWGASDVISTGPCICPSRGCYNALSGDRDRPAEVTWDNEPDVRCPTCVRLHDGQNAKAWLDVTDADVEQVGLVDEVRQYYFNVVEATLSAAFNNPRQLKEDDPSVNKRLEAAEGHRAGASPKLHGVSFSGFCHAYSLVSTRAFWVDAYHGLAMVPIADVFNHSNDNHLHMESDYDLLHSHRMCIRCHKMAYHPPTKSTISKCVPCDLFLPTVNCTTHTAHCRTRRFSRDMASYSPRTNTTLSKWCLTH